MDILWDVQHSYGYLPAEAVSVVAVRLGLAPEDVMETASFYHFFHSKPSGRYRIYLSNTVIAKMNGYQAVYDALERETGVRFGETDGSGMFGLFETPCIGLSDQEPAMMIDSVVFTRLTPESVADIIAQLKQGQPRKTSRTRLGCPSEVCLRRRPDWSPTSTRGDRCSSARQVTTRRCSRPLPGSDARGDDRPSPIPVCAATAVPVFAPGSKWQLCRDAPGATTSTSSATPTRVNPARSRTGRC